MATAKRKAGAATPATAPKFHVVGKEEATASEGGLDFGTLKTGAKSEKSDKPIIILEGEALELASQYLKHAPEFKRLEKFVGSKGSVKAQMAPLLRAAYFRHFAGRAIDASTLLTTVKVQDGEGEGIGQQIKLVFKEQYAKTCLALATIAAAVPKAVAHFKIANILKIDFELIAKEKQQPFVTAIMTAAKELGIEEGISVTKCVQPVPGFHAQRTTLFTPAENIAIDEIIPITAYPQL